MKKRFLLFSTGVDRLPAVQQNTEYSFLITNGGPFGDKLPEAHTCFNQLVLFNYGNDKELLRDKLVQAITMSEGFGLK